jgi:tyrosyl-tRNA synthetase
VEVGPGILYLPELLKSQFGATTSHWRRVIEQGGVKVGGHPVETFELGPDAFRDGALIQAGKRNFVFVKSV